MKCRSCGSTNLTDIFSLGELYLADWLDGDEKPEKYPLGLILCNDCNLLQLKHTTPSSSLYNERYGYRSGINQTMRIHLAGIAQKASKSVALSSNNIVVDIGCNDGTLLKFYNTDGIKRIGFDPIQKFADNFSGTGIRFINDYFSGAEYKEYYGEKKASIITAIAMFYDLDDPNTFVSDLADILDRKGVLIIQQNYLGGMLEQNAFDNIVHEHIGYYSLLSLEKLLDRYGLEVFDVELNDLNGGSFRTYIGHKGEWWKRKTVFVLREFEAQKGFQGLEVYKKFADRIGRLKGEIYGVVATEVAKGKVVYLYGASTRGNTLLQYCGLDYRLIKAASERNPEKWGKKFASVGIPVISEEQARRNKPDFMFVCPWYFKSEFVKRESEYLRDGGKFIFPLPSVEIVEARRHFWRYF